MKMTFRWYGQGNDDITLEKIKQIPSVEGIVWSLHDMPAGELWPEERIIAEKEYIESNGFHIDVVESVNVHEDIKLGLDTREQYIDNYKENLRLLAKHGVKVVCYNFMPVFDWTRTDLNKKLEDGSTALFFEKAKIGELDPFELIENMLKDSDFTMAGYEPERLLKIKETFKAYEGFTSEDLWGNLEYFLKAIIPVCEEVGIKMGIHPDDPAFPIYGLPRIIINKENIGRFLNLVDSPCNGLSLCTGSLGSTDVDIVDIVNTYHEKIHFIHIRNVRRYENGDFIEVSHRACDGNVDTIGVIKALHENGFTGYVRPDHGRHLWGEEKWCRAGYGLYDRAFGIMYIMGAWDALEHK